MKYRRVGRTGLKVSAVSLGGWLTFGNSVDVAGTREVVAQAFDLGINSFDTADVYAQGAGEAALADALAGRPRKDYVLATKVFWPTGPGPNDKGLSRKHILESIHASLRRLKTDYVDLYYCHRWDPETPVDEVAYCMESLVQKGKALYWGVSCWTAEQIQSVQSVNGLRHRPVVDQPPYNLLDRRIEDNVLHMCKQHEMGLITFSALAEGVLTAKYLDGVPADSRASDPRSNRFITRYLAEPLRPIVKGLADLAAKAGMPPAELAVAWCLRRPEVSSVIVGASRPAQLEMTARAAERELDADLLAALDRLVEGAPNAEPPIT